MHQCICKHLLDRPLHLTTIEDRLKDIKPPCLVQFRKHNGRGRRITERTVFVESLFEYPRCISMVSHTYKGKSCDILARYGKKDYEIVKIIYLEYKEGKLEAL